MAHKFLSDPWFDEANKIAESFGKIQLPEKLIGFIINLTVDCGPDGEMDIHFSEGRFMKNHHPAAKATLALPYDLCFKALLQNDTKAAMKGFLTRKIKVRGDMTQMLTLAGIKAEGDLDALRVRTLEMTEPVA